MPERANIQWLFERNVFEGGNPERMAKIVREKGMACADVAFECVGGDERELRPLGPVPFSDDDSVFVYGSMNLLKWLLRERRWPTLAWYDFPRLRCRSYYAHWGRFLLQQDYAFLPLAEVHRRRDWLFHTFGRDGRIFIRPDDNAKSFAGGVVDEEGFDKWWELANFYDPGPDCLAIVARPQALHAEWRLVVAGRKVVTGSQYRRDGREEVAAGCPQDAAAFADAVAGAAAFDPHPVYVMDVCQTDAGYRMVEIGSVSCASLYACDLHRLVDVICEAGRAGGR